MHLQKKRTKEGERGRQPKACTPHTAIPTLLKTHGAWSVRSQAPQSTPRQQDRARSKPGAGPIGPHKGMRPSHGHRASQRTCTREGEGELPCEGITEQRMGTEARQVDSVCSTAAHHRMHLPRSQQSSQRGQSTMTTPTHLQPSLHHLGPPLQCENQVNLELHQANTNGGNP